MSDEARGARDGDVALFERILRSLELLAAVVGGVMTLAAMFLTAADALMRYLFNAPLAFNYYLTESYLMVGLMTMPLAWGYRAGGYIRIYALAGVLPAALRNIMLRAGLLVSAAYVGALAWLAGVRFWEVYKAGDVQMGVIDWPVAWSWVWIPIGLTLLALRLLANAIGPAQELHFEHDDTAEGAT
jgi:TRAP-type C4-dicarboxylate transport system permease small subunit